MAEYWDVKSMKKRIKKGLKSKLIPMVALEPLPVLLDLVKVDGEQLLQVTRIHYLVVGIYKGTLGQVDRCV